MNGLKISKKIKRVNNQLPYKCVFKCAFISLSRVRSIKKHVHKHFVVSIMNYDTVVQSMYL